MKSGSLLSLSLAALAGCGTVDATSDGDPAVGEMPSMEEMMARMEELAQPGEGHARLQMMAGTFHAKGTFWMDPAAPPTPSEGTNTNAMILGGRYLQQVYKGEFQEVPWAGLALTGYNNATGQYEGVWIDDHSTMIMPVSVGTADESGNVPTMGREFVDPISGVATQTREVVTIIDENHHTFEWFQPGPDGEEMRMMLIEYTRAE